jgi:hypothetical protein
VSLIAQHHSGAIFARNIAAKRLIFLTSNKPRSEGRIPPCVAEEQHHIGGKIERG